VEFQIRTPPPIPPKPSEIGGGGYFVFEKIPKKIFSGCTNSVCAYFILIFDLNIMAKSDHIFIGNYNVLSAKRRGV